MKLNNRNTKTHVLVATLFLLLAISLAGLMYGYWSLVIQPRLYVEAESNAKFLAESQARIIAGVISSKEDRLIQEDIDELIDQVLVFVDPMYKYPYFLGLSLELDPDAVVFSSKVLNVSEGDMSCQHCFLVATALYSQNSYELLGVVEFAVSDVYYENLKTDIKKVLLLESLFALTAIFVVWIAISFLISRLNQEIKNRKKIMKQLVVAKESAEKASQTKSEFLANMSHEIRTPLNAITGMCHILFRTSLDKRQQDLLKKLDASAKLLLSLINDLLDFSKIEAGKLELEANAFNLNEVLENLAEMVMTPAGEKSIDIMYFASHDIPNKLIGDPLRLGQVLLNLFNNAIKFTEQGDILLSVKVADSLPTTDSESICLQFSIRDSGIGIKPEDIKKLFNSFTQADNSTTRKFGGTGLGLSICKQLVQQMGGDISVVSTYGQGSTFTFTVNVGFEADSELVEYRFPAIIQNTHVLVIDDNSVAQNVFKHMLDCFGFSVSIASSVPMGIEILQHYASRNNPIKLILLDAKIPNMGGMEASRIIKMQLDLELIPSIIMITTYRERRGHTSSHVNWDDSLVRPISQSVLYDSIVNIFSEQQAFPSISIDHSFSNTHNSLSDKHVLLTEDNLINQEVACALIAELNIKISIANNGKEAVEAIKTNRFDLIFMDLQMPEMDGFEATRLIRLDKNYQQVPIIAMTAHAMRGDRDKCLNAQMDDYITKPIDVDKLFGLLNKWLGNDAQKDPLTRMKMIAVQTNNTSHVNIVLPDLKSINTQKALVRMRGKQALLIRLLISFRKQNANLAQQIREAIEANDLPLAKALIHSLKGEAGTLDATSLYSASQNLEQQLQQNSNKQLTYLLGELGARTPQTSVSTCSVND